MNYFEGHGAMEVNGLMVQLHMPRALDRRYDPSGMEVAQNLPPYAPRKSFVVDEYHACPENWMRGGADEASCFVPVKVGYGCWLDFNGNRANDHDVAVLVSVQGVNALTAMPCDGFRLEQYRSACPVHGTKFGHDRFCKECGYKWPPQNYLAMSAQTHGYFWLDGFASAPGKICQFVFTADEQLGVATQVIGDRRSYAIGVAFYLSKNPRPRPKDVMRDGMIGGGLEMLGGMTKSMGIRDRGGDTKGMQLDVAYGAQVNQRVGLDPNEPDYWQKTPTGVVYINYAPEFTVERILGAGKRDMTQSGYGPLAGLRGHDARTASKR